MKWLLDENLSFRLIRLLPASVVVETCSQVGLCGADDLAVWRYAAAYDLLLITKDDDFRQLAIIHGPPPKVVWLSVGNSSTDQIAILLVNHFEHIQSFAADPDASLLVIR